MRKLYYKESVKILALIKKSKRIVINCHRSPDLDSVGCALAMREVLIRMGKRVTVICPTEIPKRYYFFKKASLIHVKRISKITANKFDLFVSLDTSGAAQLTGDINGVQPGIQTIVIDHHVKNSLDGVVRLIDPSQYSCAEVLYRVFFDWGVNIDRTLATYLYTGIAGDTVLFSVPGYPASTLEVVSDLIRRGADKNRVIQNIFRNYNGNMLKTLGTLLQLLLFDRKHHIAYVVVPRSVEQRLLNFSDAKEAFADLFFSSIEGVEVGLFFLEAEGFVKVGMRSRGKFDCGKFIRLFEGGGHRAAAGAFVKGKLQAVVKDVLREARRWMRRKRK